MQALEQARLKAEEEERQRAEEERLKAEAEAKLRVSGNVVCAVSVPRETKEVSCFKHQVQGEPALLTTKQVLNA